MDIKKLNRGDAEKAMSEWVSSFPQLPVLDSDYSVVRNDLSILFKEVSDKVYENELKKERARQYEIERRKRAVEDSIKKEQKKREVENQDI